jgi:ribose-phosphate pyrophosphokinase
MSFVYQPLPSWATFDHDGPRAIRIVAGNGNRELAERVAQELGQKLTPWQVGLRSCGEVFIDTDEGDVRHKDVYVIQPTCGHDGVEINQSVLELLFLIRRLKLKGADRVTAVVPFFAYARQDRKCDLRGPISASAVSQLISKMGVDRVLTLDLHSGQIQGYFNGRAPLDNLQMAQEFAQYVRQCGWFERNSTVIVSPDAGGVARAHAFADLTGVSHIVTVMKRRERAGVVGSMQTVGEVAGYTCIIIDDMIDTGGTLVAACKLLKDLGAVRVVACITHGILTDPCIERVNNCDALAELVVSDSLPQREHQRRCPKLRVLGIASLLAQAMKTYNTEQSISGLFRKPSTPKPALVPPPNRVVSPIHKDCGDFASIIDPQPQGLVSASIATASSSPSNRGNSMEGATGPTTAAAGSTGATPKAGASEGRPPLAPRGPTISPLAPPGGP